MILKRVCRVKLKWDTVVLYFQSEASSRDKADGAKEI